LCHRDAQWCLEDFGRDDASIAFCHAVSAYAAPRSEDEHHRVATDPQPLLDYLPALAAEHGDEHVIKLTEAVLREYPRTRDTTLLVAAGRFRNMIEPA
jgi:hypothetical protein